MKRKQNVNKLKEDYLIRIKSRTEHEDLPDMVELTTRGSFVHKNGSFFITYRDTETTGYAGCTTTLKVAEDARNNPAPEFFPPDLIVRDIRELGDLILASREI